MVRQVDLIQYLPLFIAEYKEIQHIMDAENPEFQFTADEGERIKDNQFIVSCDASGIARFERLLKITPSSEDTLESRISRVLIRWNDVAPYTWKVFLQKMDSLCGTDFEVNADWKNYLFEVITHLDLFGQVDELEHILDFMIPANLVVISKNKLVHNLTGTVFTGGTVVDKNYYTISSKINNEHLLERTLKFVGSVVKRNTYDFKVETNKEYILHDEVHVNSVVVTHIKREVE